ncbi:MAG: O-antigen ligase family protein [Candidatus Omnitrophica bacterium]|nr:O-antigen ligase family protein [Candidatus Omnitrophota bacterium]
MAQTGALLVPSASQSGRRLPGLLLVGALGLICGVMGVRSWALGLAGLAGLLLCAVGLQHPQASWRALLVLTLLVTNYLPPAVTSPLFWILLAVFLAGAWMELAEAGRPVDLVHSGFWVCAGLWGCWAAIATLHALDPVASLKEIARYLLSFLTFFTYLNWCCTKARIRGLFTWMERVTVVLAGLLLLGEAARLLHASSWGAWIVGSHLRTNSDLGLCFASVLPVMVSVRMASARWRRWLSLASVGLVVGALVVSRSRAACLAASIGVVIAMWWMGSPRVRRWLTRGVLMGLLGCGWLGWHALRHPEGIRLWLSGRDLVWAAALQAMREHPWLGVGPGNWSRWFQNQFLTVDFLLRDANGNTFFLPPTKLLGEAHNVFLTKGAEMGVPSAVGLGILTVIWARAARTAATSLLHGWDRAVALGCCASMAGLLAFACFENGAILGRGRGADIVVVWLLMAFPLVAARWAQSAPRHSRSRVAMTAR